MKRIWVEMQNPVFTHQKQVINRLLTSCENCQIEMLVFMQYLWTGVHYGVMMTLCTLRTHTILSQAGAAFQILTMLLYDSRNSTIQLPLKYWPTKSYPKVKMLHSRKLSSWERK